MLPFHWWRFRDFIFLCHHPITLHCLSYSDWLIKSLDVEVKHSSQTTGLRLQFPFKFAFIPSFHPLKNNYWVPLTWQILLGKMYRKLSLNFEEDQNSLGYVLKMQTPRSRLTLLDFWREERSPIQCLFRYG